MSFTNIPEKWRNLRPFLAELGIRDSLLYVLQRLLHALPGSPQLLKFYLIAQSVPNVTVTPGDSAYRFTWIEREAYQTDWFPRPAAIIQARFEQNARCLVAFRGNDAIACLWYVTGRYQEDVVRCQFEPEPAESCAWDFDIYIHPRYRMTRVFGLLWSHAFSQLQQDNIIWSLSRIDAFNAQSMRSHQRLGAQITGSVIFLRFESLQLTFPAQGRVHVSRSAQPLITVKAPDMATSVSR